MSRTDLATYHIMKKIQITLLFITALFASSCVIQKQYKAVKTKPSDYQLGTKAKYTAGVYFFGESGTAVTLTLLNISGDVHVDQLQIKLSSTSTQNEFPLDSIYLVRGAYPGSIYKTFSAIPAYDLKLDPIKQKEFSYTGYFNSPKIDEPVTITIHAQLSDGKQVEHCEKVIKYKVKKRLDITSKLLGC